MFGKLFAQALVRAAPGGEIRKAYEEASQEFHGNSSALTLKERSMIGAVRSQSPISLRICFRLTFRFPTRTMPRFLLENNRNLDWAWPSTRVAPRRYSE
jgi:hypothetical protein